MIKAKGNILLVLSSTGVPDEAIAHAVREAREKGSTLVALYVIRVSQASTASETFTDTGFVGDKPSEALSEAIMKDYRQRGYEELGRVQIRAMEEGVLFEPMLETGDHIENVLRVIRSMDIGAVVVVRKKKRPLFRYFTKSIADEIKERTGLPVREFIES
jgi:nucleotide-binding universal stress UspA family protein